MNYAKFDHDSRVPKLVCQECDGAGESVDDVVDGRIEITVPCGYCEGTGYVTPHIRGLWLTHQPRRAVARTSSTGGGE